MSPKELFDTYIHMLYEYMQRRSELNNEQFQKVIDNLKPEEMVASQTIIQSARDEGKYEATRNFIKQLIDSTRMSDAVIALKFDVKEELVKTIREEVKMAKIKAAMLKKTAKVVTPKKAARPKRKKL